MVQKTGKGQVRTQHSSTLKAVFSVEPSLPWWAKGLRVGPPEVLGPREEEVACGDSLASLWPAPGALLVREGLGMLEVRVLVTQQQD